jgi:hypothetical protein
MYTDRQTNIRPLLLTHCTKNRPNSMLHNFSNLQPLKIRYFKKQTYLKK